MEIRGTKTSSGLKKVRRRAKQEKLPQVIECKKRRLINRLNQNQDSGTIKESIKVLRKRLHNYIVKTPIKKLNEKQIAEKELIRQLGWTYENYKTELYNSKRERKTSAKRDRRRS